MNVLSVLAKLAVENYIENKEIIPVPENFPKDFLERKAGVFVTIEKDGNLRGCIGTYLSTRENIGEETIHNAISAATGDFRFGPIKKTEFPHLSYMVYILSAPQKITDLSELDPQKFGVILKAGKKCGLLLPGLSGIDTIAKQIEICCQKGGIVLKKDSAEIYKFTVEKHAKE
jgi:AmmeMemoRadiSam system protein A